MPYIKMEDRFKFDELLDELGGRIDTEGELNYVFTILMHLYLKNKGERYATYNTLIGALECAKLELYRRRTSTYEDKKIGENGDVPQ
jgi:hypothetical protein